MREYGKIDKAPDEHIPEQSTESLFLKKLQELDQKELGEFEASFVSFLKELEEIANKPNTNEVEWSSIQAARAILESLDRLSNDAQADTFPNGNLKTLFQLFGTIRQEKNKE